MRDLDELVALERENFLASFARLAEHCSDGAHRRFGSVFAYVTRLPIPLFNGAVVSDGVTEDELEAALRWVVGHDVPLRLFVPEGLDPRGAAVARRHGLERSPVPYPGMALHPISDPPRHATGVVVEPVGEATFEEFRSVAAAFGLEREVVEALYSDGFLRDQAVDAFVGRLDGQALGYSLAIRSVRTSGVYNVGTVPAARRRGLGAALTWAAVAAARRAGYDVAVLQSSQMGLPMYEAMGFRTVTRYAVFREPAPRPTGQATPVPPSPQ